MIFDTQSMFSDAQAITATARSTNVIDLGAVDTPKHAVGPITRDLGRGRPVELAVQVVEAFNTLTSLTIALQVDNDVAFGSPKTVMTLSVPLAGLTLGARLPPFYIPEGVDERYVSFLYTVVGTNPTLGKITAGLTFASNSKWSA